MMIGDNEVDSCPSCALCRRKGASARIYADHQPNACDSGALYHVTRRS